MTRIGILTTSYPRDSVDDAGIFVERLVNGYEECGHTGVVIVPHDASEPINETRGAFSLHRYKYGFIKKGSLAFGSGIIPNIRRNPLLVFQAPTLFFGMVLKVITLKQHIDVMHANWIISGCAAAVARLFTGIPFIVTVRGEDVRLLEKAFIGWIFRFGFFGAEKIVTVSDELKRTLITELAIKSDRVEVVPNGVTSFKSSQEEARHFLKSKNLPVDRPLLVFIGTIIPRKRIELLLELLTLPGLEACALVLSGREDDAGYMAELRHRAATLGVLERVFFRGKIAPSEVGYYLKGARCYVSASSFEGRSNSILEAMAAGVPVCVSDIPSHREIVSREAGELFPVEKLEIARDYIVGLGTSPHTTILKALRTWKDAAQEYERCGIIRKR